MREKVIIGDLRQIRPAWAEYGIFIKMIFSPAFEKWNHTIAVKSAQIHSRFEFPVSDKIPLCKPIGRFPVPVTADYERFLSKREKASPIVETESPGSGITTELFNDRYLSIRIQATMIETNHAISRRTSQNETAKIQKEVAGVPSPLSTLVGMKIFQNFSPLSVDRILKGGRGVIIIIINLPD